MVKVIVNSKVMRSRKWLRDVCKNVLIELMDDSLIHHHRPVHHRHVPQVPP